MSVSCTLLVPFDPISKTEEEVADEDSGSGGTSSGRSPTSSSSGSSTSTTPDAAGGGPTTGCIFEDDLRVDKNAFAVPAPFAPASWSYSGDGYRMTRLSNAGELTLFTQETDLGDVTVDVDAASTGISDQIQPIQRQNLVVVAASISGGTVTAWACGVELLPNGPRTSVLKLTGSPDNLTVEPLDRKTRAAVAVDEEFKLTTRLANGTLTCKSTIRQTSVSTATAQIGNASRGAVGLFSRQSQARFRNLRLCKL